MRLFRVSMVAALGLFSACSSASTETGKLYADECRSAVEGFIEPTVFEGASNPGSPSFMAALAFEREVAAWNSGLKESRRPDFELIVLYTNDSDGFECGISGIDGFTVATVSTFGDAAPNVRYAKRESATRIAVMVGIEGRAPEHQLTLAVAPDSGIVERLYPSDTGYETAPGLSIRTQIDGSGEICDHREGSLRRFSASQATVETTANGCERHDAEDVYESSPPFVYRYDTNGNRKEELWVDELGRPGRTEYRNELNDNGDWTRRVMLMESAEWQAQREIREEYRHLHYRTADR